MTVLLIILLFLVCFPAFWCGIVWIISRTGWHSLAVYYETDLPPTGRALRMVSGTIGIANYNGVLNVHIEPEGLRLAVVLPFRFGHPPLLIPWSDITEIKARKVLWLSMYDLRIGDPHIRTIRLPEKVIDAIQDAAPNLAG